jgi:hypothetical protein
MAAIAETLETLFLGTILTKLYISVQYGKTSNEFVIHNAASKVKVTILYTVYQSHKITS